MRQIPISLLPIAEQRRIVEAIETHFTRLDATVAALTRVRVSLKRYRASVLKAELPISEDRPVNDLVEFVTDGEHATPPRAPAGVYLTSARTVQNGWLALGDVDFVTAETHEQLCK